MRMWRNIVRFRLVPALVIVLALSTPAVARVIAIGDVHGNLERFRATLREAALIDAQDHWIGGNTILVQTGDVLDRGPNSRGVLDLLMSLERQAPNSGGQVIALVGNHEAMNIVGALDYVSAAEWASYANEHSEARRQAAYQEYAKWFKRRYAAGEAKPREQWLAEHPPGFLEHRQAFAPDGKYGHWLRQHDAVAQVGDSVFVHGGIHPTAVPLSVKQLNDEVHAGQRVFDTARDFLLKRDAILPFFTIEEINVVAREELELARKELATLQARPAAGDRNGEDAVRQALTLLEQFLALKSSGEQGPLLFRGFANWSDAEGEAVLPKLLSAFQAQRFVVGHTPQPDRIVSRWGGRVFLIDTSRPQPEAPGGVASALEIDGPRITAIYKGARLPLPAAAPNVTNQPAAPKTAADARVWRDAQGNPLPFKNADELLEFLRTANVVSERTITTGVTAPHKLTLEKNGVRANAIFRLVDEEKTNFVSESGQREMFFRDSYLFEPAAYEISHLVGLDNVPPAIVRRLHGQAGSLQVWVENAMSERGRAKNGAQAPDRQRWNKQMETIIIFDALVYNTDRNPDNILITPDWKVWMIDHTRAFRLRTDLPNEKIIRQCDRTVYERMKALDEKTLRERLKDYLRPGEIKALLKRRDRIVNKLDQMIAAQGEKAVLFDLTPQASGE